MGGGNPARSVSRGKKKKKGGGLFGPAANAWHAQGRLCGGGGGARVSSCGGSTELGVPPPCLLLFAFPGWRRRRAARRSLGYAERPRARRSLRPSFRAHLWGWGWVGEGERNPRGMDGPGPLSGFRLPVVRKCRLGFAKFQQGGLWWGKQLVGKEWNKNEVFFDGRGSLGILSLAAENGRRYFFMINCP